MQEHKKKILFAAIVLFFVCQTAGYAVRLYFPHRINRGVGFGLIDNNFYALAASIFFAAILILYLRHHKDKYFPIIVLAGALSNIAERLIYGNVSDYFKIGRWPAFNLADVLILAGLITIAYKKATV